MSAFHAYIRDLPQHSPLSGPSSEHLGDSAHLRASSRSSMGAAPVYDNLSSVWHSVVGGVKHGVDKVEDNLSHAYSNVAHGLKGAISINNNPFHWAVQDAQAAYNAGYDSLKDFYDFRERTFHTAGQDIAAVYHGGQTVFNTVGSFGAGGITGGVLGGLGGSFLTLAALAALFIFVKA